MTNEILLLNPRKKGRKRRKSAGTKKRTTSPRKRPVRRKNPAKRARKPALKGRIAMPRKRKKARKRTTRRNPSPRRKAITRRVRTGITGLNFKNSLKNAPILAIGMFVTKFAAKRGGGALEDDRASWTGMSYVKGGVGSVAGAFIANMIKPGLGQKILDGSFAFLMYKAIQNHIVPKNDFLMNQFGFGQGESTMYSPGDVATNEAGEPFILGQDGQSWIPLDEGGEEDMPELAMGEDYYDYGDVLEPPGRLGMGQVLEPPGRLGFGQSTVDAYRQTLFER